MSKSRLLRIASVAVVLGALSLILVGMKYWHWERTLYADPVTGLRTEMSNTGVAYTKLFHLVYFPVMAALQPVVQRLSYGGVAVEVLVNIVGVTLENTLILYAWFIYRPRLKIRREKGY